MIERTDEQMNLPYYLLRRLIGILGLALPAICVLGGLAFGATGLQRSLSYYYHSNMRDFFVGLLFATSLFLGTYRGYDWRDELAGKIGSAASLGVALFPCLKDGTRGLPAGLFGLEAGLSDRVHLGCAAVFFLSLAITSIALFTRSDKPKDERGKEKLFNNIIYVVCGVLIILSMAAVLVVSLILKGNQPALESGWITALEAVMLAAFGLSWLVKGESLKPILKRALRKKA